jgi:hypothetical protein
LEIPPPENFFSLEKSSLFIILGFLPNSRKS